MRHPYYDLVFSLEYITTLIIPPHTTDELMVISEQLRESLKQSQEIQVQLTDALVDRTLG